VNRGSSLSPVESSCPLSLAAAGGAAAFHAAVAGAVVGHDGFAGGAGGSVMLSFFHRGSWAERNPTHADFVVMNGAPGQRLASQRAPIPTRRPPSLAAFSIDFPLRVVNPRILCHSYRPPGECVER
jgi:hypothetical protein